MKDYIENITGAERRFYNDTPELRAEENAKKTVKGLGIVYNSLSENFAPWMEGGLYEMIDPGAARGLLDDEDIMILFNHDPSLVLARNKNTATLTETDQGVTYEYETPDTTVGNDLRTNIALKNVRKSSFAFIPDVIVKEKRTVETLGEINVRRITKFKRLFDFSAVTYPAYNNTDVVARAYQQEISGAAAKENDRLTKMRQIQHEIFKIKNSIF